jgi:hypothetical protein
MGLAPRTRRLGLAIAVLLTLGLTVGSVLGEQRRVQAESAVTTAVERGQAETALDRRVGAATSTIRSISELSSAADAALEDSAGRVLVEAPRSSLAGAVGSAEALLGDLRGEVSAVQAGDGAGAALERLVRTDSARVAAVRGALRDAIADVGVAVTRWQAEQDRVAAEVADAAAIEAAGVAEAAAAEAAESARRAADAAAAEVSRRAADVEARAARSAAGASDGSPAAAPAAPAVYAEYVWTTGFQAELDACRGSVNMTPSFGTAVIGEHWSCGGRGFPKSPGTLVQLSGAMSGTYRVGAVVAVLNQRTHRIGDVPRGYDLLYQTCINGDNTQMSFTQLTRVG